MSDEPTLEYTVHHKGQVYPAGMTAGQIGPAAAELGDHVWAGGKPPAKRALPKEGDPDGGTMLGSPPVPPVSGLPSPPQMQTLAGAAGAPVGTPPTEDGGDADEAGDSGGTSGGSGSTPKKATGGGRRGGSGS